ncbi:hypothetical protein JHV675_52680 [Mycobacterium avium subsp. hominissuis]
MVDVLPASSRINSAADPVGGSRVRILGVNAVFHDPAAALVIDGRVVAAGS